MAIESDAQLMLRVKEGDDASFEALLEKYRSPVVKFIYRMVQNSAVAEELAQDVFLRVYRARAGYEPSAKFTTWLFRIATHIALNALRDSRRERNLERIDAAPEQEPLEIREPGLNVEEHLVESSEAQEIRRAVEALPAKQRAAVIMHKYHELDYRQIAGALQCSESAVKSLLFRAYETLRTRLAHYAAPSAVANGEASRRVEVRT
jgi:RNA polymerase sigma-70 factor (ECF subfamily)